MEKLSSQMAQFDLLCASETSGLSVQDCWWAVPFNRRGVGVLDSDTCPTLCLWNRFGCG